MRDAFDQTFGAELREIVAERAEAVLVGGRVQSRGGRLVEIAGGEGVARGEVGKADRACINASCRG